ncbi:hypothetical protein AB0M46_35465 [Dactylosporangium sp. NPDC051485]|uniref:hypothetical protein n=1 Tax=Dactylosporangium sp. NPDC051485 TaxID=3154846 RepID=UPI00342D328F
MKTGADGRPGEDRRHRVSVAAQAQPDRCWFGFGEPTEPVGPDGTCREGGVLQTTQQYIWAFTADDRGRSVWWGTTSNATGAGMATVSPDFAAAGLSTLTRPFHDPEHVTVEFEGSYNAVHHVGPAQGIVGEAMPVQVWQYDIETGESVERTPTRAEFPGIDDVVGLRAAGSLGDVVFVGGIETALDQGAQAGGTVVLLAYRAHDAKFLGWKRFPEWDNLKNFVVADGRLYFGVGLAHPGDPGTGSGPNPPTGAVQRWTGDPRDPFRFEEVGRLGNQPAYFTVHHGRLVTGTWAGTGSEEAAGVYVSPPLEDLSTSNSAKWTLVFTAAGFFPDPITAGTMVSFAVTSYEGWVYATFGVPSVEPAMTHHIAKYPQIPKHTLPHLALAYLKSSPAGVVYRIRRPGEADQEIELLYGERKYWVYDPATEGWTRQDNLLHQDPKFGAGGFDDRWNEYVGWGAAVFRGKLYMGTFHTARVLRDLTLNPETHLLEEVLGHQVSNVELQLLRRFAFPDERAAGQVWVFDDADSPAHPLTTTGFNNACNWGVRGVLPIGDEYLFFGTNQGWQYPAEPRDDPPRRAGWQLLKMT